MSATHSCTAARVRFPDEDWLAALSQNVAEYVGRQLDSDHHSLSGRLPEGCIAGPARVHVVAPPASRSGYCISIRRFKERRQSLAELITNESLNAEAAEFLRLAVHLKRNLAVSGGTGTGKTTLLNALAAAIPHEERVLVIEETSELKLAQPHAIYFEAKSASSSRGSEVTIRDLFVDSLRMRPDRIIVGEVRSGEALDMVQSMLSGHAGSLTTVHANTPLDALTRLETLCLMTAEPLPHYVARLQVASAIHLIVQIERMKGRRRVESIAECIGIDERNRYRIRTIYSTDYKRSETGIEAQLVRRRRPSFSRLARAQFVASDYSALDWLFAETKSGVDQHKAPKNLIGVAAASSGCN